MAVQSASRTLVAPCPRGAGLDRPAGWEAAPRGIPGEPALVSTAALPGPPTAGLASGRGRAGRRGPLRVSSDISRVWEPRLRCKGAGDGLDECDGRERARR